MKYEPRVCFTQKSKTERKRWLKDYLENVWTDEESKLAFDARLIEYLALNGRITKKIKERRSW